MIHATIYFTYSENTSSLDRSCLLRFSVRRRRLGICGRINLWQNRKLSVSFYSIGNHGFNGGFLQYYDKGKKALNRTSASDSGPWPIMQLANRDILNIIKPNWESCLQSLLFFIGWNDHYHNHNRDNTSRSDLSALRSCLFRNWIWYWAERVWELFL